MNTITHHLLGATAGANQARAPGLASANSVSTGINLSIASGCLFKVSKSHLFRFLFKKNGFLRLSGLAQI